MKITTKQGKIVEIFTTRSQYKDYIESGKWKATTKVLFHKQKDGYVMCEVELQGGETSVIKIIISNYFYGKLL